MKQYVLALDQGTTSTRAAIFDQKAKMIGVSQKELKQVYPKPDWVEHDPKLMMKDLEEVIFEVLKKTKVSITQVATIGITNQRESVVVWDKKNGKPIYNCISWQDTRTAQQCREMKDEEEGLDAYIKETTGLRLDSYFSATKLQWILNNVSGARRKAENGELLFGTIDSWIIWNLTQGESHITDFTNASRTMLFNIVELKWDDELLGKFTIPREMLPDVTHSGYFFGLAKLYGQEIQITGVAGDQQAALFGQGCVEPGQAKNTYGTGCFILMNTGENIQYSTNGLLSTIALGFDGKIDYALEGSVFMAGAAVDWLRDGLKLITSADETEVIAKKADPDSGVYVVPAFAGLGAPFWDMYARGGIFGLTRDSGQQDLIKATLDSMAYQTRDVLQAMAADSGLKITELKVDGGASANNYLMQFQANIMGIPVERPSDIESTALGAAYLAGITAGIWNKDTIFKKRSVDKTFKPKMDDYTRNKLYEGWHNAVKRCMNWAR
ncbi:glycerol kinase GlpK [Reichenbachiella agariperforans]|uniref:glycerol kinase GlpK n=1 Tax=Reichenbachiella agariperforans TaxID=156994 RepID=UPI001C085D3F|nr:glycerol kinase GlpK [Reichenbachiella agariperforans]MBU2915404.1 glycerol kinase GlpK [Reichenbachiella agariperforans]